MDEQIKKPISRTIIAAIEKAPSFLYPPSPINKKKKKGGRMGAAAGSQAWQQRRVCATAGS